MIHLFAHARAARAQRFFTTALTKAVGADWAISTAGADISFSPFQRAFDDAAKFIALIAPFLETEEAIKPAQLIRPHYIPQHSSGGELRISRSQQAGELDGAKRQACDAGAVLLAKDAG
jgi:hypothetical protein